MITRTAATTVLFLILVGLVNAAPAFILDPSASSGHDSDTWQGNLHNLIQGGTTFNTIQTFDKSGDTLLWVPWFDSATSCDLGNLKTYGSGACSTSNDWDNNVMVTDEFSEVMYALAAGNSSHESLFDAGYNTIVELGVMSSWGSIPYWVVCRDGSTLTDVSGADSASDATHRLVLALYMAGENPEFSSANRNKYNSLADTMIADSLTYEIVQDTQATENYGDVTFWNFGGRDAATTGIDGTDSGPDVWTGYGPDAALAFIAACEQTGTSTYCDVAEDIVRGLLTAASYTGGTSSGDFSVAPFNYQWEESGTYMSIEDCTDCNSYHFNPGNEQWDDADAPRYLGLGHVLRAWELSQGSITGAFSDLQDYLTAWHATGTLTATQTCLQYYFDGTCVSGAQASGYYNNGLGAGAHTYLQTTTLDDKLDEALGHYDFGTDTFDVSSCGNGLTYRGVRVTKGLIWATGVDTAVFNQTPPGPPENITFNVLSPTGDLSIAEPDNQAFSYTLVNPDGLSTTTTWFLDSANQTGAHDLSSFTFTSNMTSAGVYNVTVVVASPQNVIRNEWTLTVNDTTPQDVAFNTITPGTNPDIDEPYDQDFSITLDNPHGLTTATTWFLDGANQTDEFDTLAYTFTGSYDSEGTHNVTVVVVSPQNVIRNEWTLTVTDTEQIVQQPSVGGSGGGVAPLLGVASSEESIAEAITETPGLIELGEAAVREFVANFFADENMDAEELVEILREYFEEVEQ